MKLAHTKQNTIFMLETQAEQKTAMRDNNKETALTRVRRRSSGQAYQENSEGEEIIKQYTMFAIGAVTFLTGFWTLACLANLFFQAIGFSAP